MAGGIKISGPPQLESNIWKGGAPMIIQHGRKIAETQRFSQPGESVWG